MNRLSLLFLAVLSVFIISSCSKDDPPLPDNTVAFTTNAMGFEDNLSEMDIKVTASRAVESAVSVTINLEPTGLTYGTQFTTEPAATDNKITVNIPAGASEATVKLKRVAGALTEGSESLSFKISAVASPAVMGQTADLKVSFSAIISSGAEMQLDGGGGEASAVNSVFVDFSNNKQVAVRRDSWDLGFYSGTDFRVIINNTNGASAIKVDKTDLAQVTSADIKPEDLRLGRGLGSFALFDDITGDLTKTVIPAISAAANDNKVYVINRAGGSGAISAVEDLYKVRVIRKETGYTLQYAKINETTVKTIDVAKDNSFNFKYVSLTGAAVNVEPAKDKWEIQWGWAMYNAGTIPYGYSDMVFVNNHAGVTAAQVLTSTVSYDSFNESNLASVTFSDSRNTIGSSWRATTGTVGVLTDRFYVVKDAAGNVYKLKFVNFTTQDGGERGKPKIAYALVKKGA